MPNDNLTGRVVLVTGAARRIGAAIVTRLHENGALVAIHYRASAVEANALAGRLNDRRANSASTFQGDLLDVDAIDRLVAAVVDWGGGTRIGESFKRFNYDWGRRVLGRGAVVAVLSDAWDRGDVDLLERETARLRRSCRRLLWLNL